MRYNQAQYKRELGNRWAQKESERVEEELETEIGPQYVLVLSGPAKRRR